MTISKPIVSRSRVSGLEKSMPRWIPELRKTESRSGCAFKTLQDNQSSHTAVRKISVLLSECRDLVELCDYRDYELECANARNDVLSNA